MADSSKLALGLDDIIKMDRSTNRRGRGGGRGGRGGANNGFRARGGGGLPRTANPSAGRWKNDLHTNNTNRTQHRNSGGVNSTTKLLISNLDFGVTTNDIEELFGDVGAVRVARVHYDENGRSLGTAEVVFERRVDAVSAQQKYNTLNLDGRPMDIRLVGGADDGSRSQSNRFSSDNGNRNQRSANRSNNQLNGFQGNRKRGNNQPQNGTSGKKAVVSADDLDAELDAYRAETKQKK